MAKNTVRGIGFPSIQGVLSAFLGSVLLGSLRRFFSSLAYGAYSALQVSIGIAGILSVFGINAAVVKFLAPAAPSEGASEWGCGQGLTLRTRSAALLRVRQGPEALQRRGQVVRGAPTAGETAAGRPSALTAYLTAAARFVSFLLAPSTLCIDSFAPDAKPHPSCMIYRGGGTPCVYFAVTLMLIAIQALCPSELVTVMLTLEGIVCPAENVRPELATPLVWTKLSDHRAVES